MQQLPTLVAGQCWELLRLLLVAKRLTGFKLCALIPNNTQQHATGCANGHNM